MDDNPYDPRGLSRRFYREALWLRDTLESVARELERMAARGQGQTDILLGRARRCGSGCARACRRGGLRGDEANRLVLGSPVRAQRRVG